MKILRLLAAGLLWILACVAGLLGIILCVTIILLPLGILVLMLARKLYSAAARLTLPAGVRHPKKEGAKAIKNAGNKMKRQGKKMRRRGKKAIDKGRKSLARIG